MSILEIATMANSKESQEVAGEQNVIADLKSMDIQCEQVNVSSDTFINVNQRIILSNNCATPQLLQVKIRIPKVLLIDDDEIENNENMEQSSNNVEKSTNSQNNDNEYFSDKKCEDDASRREPIDLEIVTVEDFGRKWKNDLELTTNDFLNEEIRAEELSSSIENSFGSFNRRESYRKYISDITSPTTVNTSFDVYNISVGKKFCPFQYFENNFTKESPKISNINRNNSIANLNGFVEQTVKFFESQARQQPIIIHDTEIEFRRKKPQQTSKLIEEKIKQFFSSHEYENMKFKKYPIEKIQPSKTSLERCRKYLKNWEKEDGEGDSKIVKELVLSKYKNALQHFIDKFERRKRLNSDEPSTSEKSTGWRDSGNNSICDEVHDHEEKAFSLLSAHSTRCENLNKTFTMESDNETQSESSHGFDEKMFLNIALGASLANSSNTIGSGDSGPSCSSRNDGDSVGTSGISQLISGPYDLYTAIDRSMKKNRHSIITYESINESRESVPRSTVTYASIEGSANKPKDSTTDIDVADNVEIVDESFERKKQIMDFLMSELHKQVAVICQASKALELCGRHKDFYETIERIEAERVLLIATLRKEMLREEMSRVEYEDIHDQKNGFVRLSDITIPLTCKNDDRSKYSRFFVCVFKSGGTLYSSGLISANEDSVLNIDKCLFFEELPVDFEISFSIYSIYARINEKAKNSSVKSIKNCSQLFQGLKHVFSPRKRLTSFEVDNCSMRSTSFILYGKGSITRAGLQQKEFKIHDVFEKIRFADVLKCNIDTLVRFENNLSGFVTLGEISNGIMMWNRQWCVMEGSKISFWDYPGRENDVEPNLTIDLSRCLQQNISTAEKTICSRPRTIYIEYGPVDDDQEFNSQECYLSMDNQVDFVMWKDALNSVLNTLILWGCMKKYFYRN